MKGFTMIELIVVIAVFGILMIAGSDFLIKAIQNANYANIQNEVRENAAAILQDIKSQTRIAACVYYYNPDQARVTALLRLSDDPNDAACATGNTTEYFQDAHGVLTRVATSSGYVQQSFGILNSANTSILNCSQAGSLCQNSNCLAGLTISPTGKLTLPGSASITLMAQQLPSQTQANFCAAVTLKDSITPRIK